MPTSLRLTKEEQQLIREKAIEINKILIKAEKMPVSESELAHIALELSLKYLKAEQSGEVYLNR